MKQTITKRFLIAGMALLILPSVVLAQKEKEKKEMQTIIINREGNTDEKTIIEIDGDKVKINGREAKDNKDVQVNINTIKNHLQGKSFQMNNRTPGAQSWNFNMDGDRMSLYNEDNNRAMLGIVTEGADKGAEIKSITKESAAEKAGLKKGDVLTKIGGKKIESADDVSKIIRQHKPGDKVDVTYLRNGKEQKATANLGSWKGIKMNTVTVTRPKLESMGRQMESMGRQMDGMVTQFDGMAPFEMPRITIERMNGFLNGRPRLGLSIQDTDEGKGVKVLEVDEESNAAKAGLIKDDIILAIDDKEVKSTDDITRTIRENKDKYTFTLKIQRADKQQTIEVKMPRKLKTVDL